VPRGLAAFEVKITIGGDWEIEVTQGNVSEKLEEEIKKTLRLVNEIDRKVEDYGNDAVRGDGSTREGE
jgi:hypothetical protein